MHLSLICLVAGMMACVSEPTPAPSDSMSMLLFDFETSEVPWRIVNDGVMGGRSQGFAEISDGTLTFTGTLVTQGGGFTSVRAPLRVDLTGYDGIELRVRGGGRTFELDVSDGTRSRFRDISRRAPFPTREDWRTVRIPFDALRSSVWGQPIRARPINLSTVRSLSLFILDGQDGPFRLEVDWIRAYQDES